MKITDTVTAARYIRQADIMARVEWNYEGKEILALRTSKGWLVAEKGRTGSMPEMQSQALINTINGAPIFFYPHR